MAALDIELSLRNYLKCAFEEGTACFTARAAILLRLCFNDVLMEMWDFLSLFLRHNWAAVYRIVELPRASI